MITNEISAGEKTYYSRQFLLPEIGGAGQQKLKNARVLVVGAGGLGCPVLTYLTGAGVGNICVIDGDVVETSNLHRQVLFGTSQVGQVKSIAAVERLHDLNPYISFTAHPFRLTPKNAIEIITGYDIVVDGTDNFPTRYLINDACVILDKPFVLGSIDRFEGQVSVMNYPCEDDQRSATYRCLYPNPPSPETAPNCAQHGVLGVLPGIIGSIQASEIIKMITGHGEVLCNKILVMDILSGSTYTFRIERSTQAVKQALKMKDNLDSFDYEDFCQSQLNNTIPQMSVASLKEQIDKKIKLQIIDIRDSDLRGKIDRSIKIPVRELENKINKISKDSPVVVYCDVGISSLAAAKILLDHGYENVYNLTGGIDAWNRLLKT